MRYDVIATRGHREGSRVQATFKDTVPMALRTDVEKTELERPSEDEVASTTEKTKLALEKLVSGKISAAQPKNVPNTANKSNFVRYTPQDGSSQQRIIKMTEVAEDPLEPSRFRHKKVPRGPGSPPPPILRSPPRKATAQDQKDWMIPPCVSNWKNNKGYTIPLDKRLAADGRGLQDVHINDKFATFSESLYIADRHAREEVRQRAAMQQRIAEKEKEAKEESLRNLAQRAREQRTGPAAAAIDGGGAAGALGAGGSGAAAGGMGLGGYGSDSDAESGSEAGSTPRRVAPAGGAGSGGEDDDDDEGAKERDRLRAERRKEREREMRMSNMGTEQRARTLARYAPLFPFWSACRRRLTAFFHYAEPRTVTFLKRSPWVWPSPPCPKSPCSTSASSTRSSILAALPTTTLTTSTTSRSSKAPVRLRPSTSPCRLTLKMTRRLEMRRASSAICKTTASIWVWPGKASPAQLTKRFVHFRFLQMHDTDCRRVVCSDEKDRCSLRRTQAHLTPLASAPSSTRPRPGSSVVRIMARRKGRLARRLGRMMTESESREVVVQCMLSRAFGGLFLHFAWRDLQRQQFIPCCIFILLHANTPYTSSAVVRSASGITHS